MLLSRTGSLRERGMVLFPEWMERCYKREEVYG